MFHVIANPINPANRFLDRLALMIFVED